MLVLVIEWQSQGHLQVPAVALFSINQHPAISADDNASLSHSLHLPLLRAYLLKGDILPYELQSPFLQFVGQEWMNNTINSQKGF